MENQEFKDECLKEHNRYRAMHGTPPLRHSLNLDKTAQEWAEELINKTNLQNSPISGRGEVGENISMRSSTIPKVYISGNDVCKQWYSDIKNFDFKRHSGPAGNFTQMIWKSTEEVGFGFAQIKGRCVVVAHYRPPGNVRGSYPTNVLPVLEKDEEDSSLSNSNHMKSDPNIQNSSRADSNLCDGDNMHSHKIPELFREPLHNPSSNSMSDDEHFEKELASKSIDDKMAARQLRQFIRDVITNINQYRRRHAVPELSHNKELDELAQKWANNLVNKSTLSNSNNSFHGDRVGENISSRWSNDLCEYNADEVVNHWYAENTKFKYNEEPQNVQGIGNFSQLIWKSTQQIGVGKAVRFEPEDQRVVVVCNFFPAGNVLRRFKLNVLPPSTDQV